MHLSQKTPWRNLKLNLYLAECATSPEVPLWTNQKRSSFHLKMSQRNCIKLLSYDKSHFCLVCRKENGCGWKIRSQWDRKRDKYQVPLKVFLGMGRGRGGVFWSSRTGLWLNMPLKDWWLWLGIKKLELLYLSHEGRKASRHSTGCLTNFLYLVPVSYQAWSHAVWGWIWTAFDPLGPWLARSYC